VTKTADAMASFRESSGQGLKTFERTMDRDKRLLAGLGCRLLEGQRKIGEIAQAVELRQSGENSIMGNIAVNLSASLTQTMRWAHWRNSTQESPDDVMKE